jgi:hypothetical protein
MPVRRGVPSGQDCILPGCDRAGLQAASGRLAVPNAAMARRREIESMSDLAVNCGS